MLKITLIIDSLETPVNEMKITSVNDINVRILCLCP